MRNPQLFTLLFPHNCHSFQAFLSLSFRSLTMMCRGLDFIGLFLFGVHSASWISRFVFCQIWKIFNYCFFEYIFSLSPFLLSSWDSLLLCILSPRSEGENGVGGVLILKDVVGRTGSLKSRSLEKGSVPTSPPQPPVTPADYFCTSTS